MSLNLCWLVLSEVNTLTGVPSYLKNWVTVLLCATVSYGERRFLNKASDDELQVVHPISQRPITPKPANNPTIRVCSLINSDSGSWNISKLLEVFWPKNMLYILRIRLGLQAPLISSCGTIPLMDVIHSNLVTILRGMTSPKATTLLLVEVQSGRSLYRTCLFQTKSKCSSGGVLRCVAIICTTLDPRN